MSEGEKKATASVAPSKVRPAAEWFSTKFPVDLVMSPWQEWSCKACGEWLAGNKGDPVVQMTLEFHVKRHEDAGDVLPP